MSEHIFFDRSEKIKILLVGFKGSLLQSLVSFLKNKKIDVYTEDTNKEILYNFIIQHELFQHLPRYLFRAYKSNAKFVVIYSQQRYPEKRFILEQVHHIRANLPIVLKGYSGHLDENLGHTLIADLYREVISKSDPVVAKQHFEETLMTTANVKKFSGSSKKHRSVLMYFLLCFTFIFLGVSFFLGTVAASVYYVASDARKIASYVKSGDMAAAMSSVESAQKYLNYFKNSTKSFIPLLKPIFKEEVVFVEDITRIADELLDVCYSAIKVGQMADNLGTSLFAKQSAVHLSQIGEFQVGVEELNKRSSTLRDRVGLIKGQDSYLARKFSIDKRLVELEEVISSGEEIVNLVADFSQIMPDMLGYEAPRRYLLLFQNNSELRPTGGFIGSFGILAFSKGRLTEFTTEDVYTADGQLKGHVSPPDPIRKYLQQENWYLRDSNFDPDFSLSAEQAEWFLKREMNLTFDGVFAFDLHSVKYLLNAVNGVYLPDYNDLVTAENLFLKAEAKVENDFFPGSTQKKDFLGSLARNLFIKLTTDKVAAAEVVTAIGKSLSEKHMLLYFHNEETQEIIDNAGWSGRVASLKCTDTCSTDYLMVVEANLGINKANFLVERDVDLAIREDKNIYKHVLSIIYTNESSVQVYPGGPYFAYVRVLLPFNIVVREVKIDSRAVPASDLTVDTYYDKKFIGFPVRVQPASKSTVSIVYDLPLSITANSMNLLVQKQPGINEYSLNVRVVSDSPVGESTGGANIFESAYTISSDHLLTLPL